MTPPETVGMPVLSPTMESGALAKWTVKEGDKVAEGDVIGEIETDKAVMELDAPASGIIGKLYVREGDKDIPVHTPLAAILLEGEGVEALTAAAPAPAAAPEATAAQEAKQEAAPPPAQAEPPPAQAKHNDRRSPSSPLARKLAQEWGVDLARLAGSGPNGRIVRRDVEQARAAAPKVGKEPDPRAYYEKDSYEEVPLGAMRAAIAKRLAMSARTIPHYALSVDCRVDALMELRAKINQALAVSKEPIKTTLNDFIVRACALALMANPDINVSWAGNALLRHKSADIGIAVALEGGGLITPILRGAQSKSLSAIATETQSLAARARERRLAPKEFEGGSFSISNLGMFGVRSFTAIINPPQAAILAVGRAQRQVVPQDATSDAVAIAHVLQVNLVSDHRAIDGAQGAQFLDTFRALIENPIATLL